MDQFNKDVLPSHEEINQEIKKVKPFHIRFIINRILLQKNYDSLLILLPYFLERQLLNDKTVFPITQALARAWIQKGPSETIKSLAAQLQEYLPANKMSNDLRILLCICADKWPISLTDFDQNFIFKNDCFDALIVAALRHSDFEQFTQILKQFPSKKLYDNPDVLQVFIKSVKSNNFLVSTFLEHLEGQIITHETLNHIKSVIGLAF